MSVIPFILLPLSILLVVLVLYLIDKVRNIELLANRLNSTPESDSSGQDRNLDPSFLGFNGKALWDLLSGKATGTQVASGDIEMLRSKFRPLLEKHVRHVFTKGLRDARGGKPRSIPNNDQPYPTLRGQVNLWLPSRNFSVLYNSGFEYANADENGAARVEANVTDTIHELFSRLELEHPTQLLAELFDASAAAEAPAAPDSDT